MSFDLTNKNIKDTFQNLLQRTGSDNRLYDLTGNQITDLRINGNLIADQYIVSSSVTNVTTLAQSGSTQFGNSSDDTHQFTGNITASGNISASGTIESTGNISTDGTLTVGSTISSTAGNLNLTAGRIILNAAGDPRITVGASNRLTFGVSQAVPSIFHSPVSASGFISTDSHITASGNIKTGGILQLTSSAFVAGGQIQASGSIVSSAGIQSRAVNITATDNGSGSAQISPDTSVALINADSDANHIVVLPQPIIGNIIHLIENGTTGYELRTSNPAVIGINGGTAVNAESAIAGAITYVKCVAVSNSNYICSQFDADGDESKVEAAS